ncbi:MAG: hypothetical protein L0H79_19195 [Intrasporangium sp.]|uniref:hypothetical protein n=1 Tax=Intrasporangium sp. TaxID=1925024 RepID=UPI0026485A9D|nr:hypothetical protein [Intrasporangium sp.]MDN5797853.1 hypothetical protein [Intrasporangium sp.]
MDQAARTTKPSRTLASVLAVLALVALTGAQSSCRERTDRSTDNRSSGRSTSSVVYSVSSNAGIETVSFIGTDGRTKTDTDVGRSWSGRGPAKHGTVRVSATTSRDGAWIKCVVKVKGRVAQEASAQGGAGSRVVCETSY